MKLTSRFVLVLVVAASAGAQEQSEAARSKIVALETAWSQAYLYRDKKALAEILAESVTLIDDDGSLQSRSVFLAGVGSARPSDVQQAVPESITVHLFGDTAIATGVFRRRGFLNGKPYVRRIRFVDTWYANGESWVCISAAATPLPQ